MDISIKIGRAAFDNPVTVASGTFGHAQKYLNQKEVKALGAIVPKTVTLHAQEGNPPVRIFETASGMINAIGIENPGVDAFIEHKLPAFAQTGVPLIISVLGYGDDQFIELIEKINACNSNAIAAIELNLSCPNLKQKKLIAQDPKAVKRIVTLLSKKSKLPLIAKLSPNITDIRDAAKAAEEGGADAISLINTLPAMAIDIHKRRSRLGNFTGGLSGPAIRPVAVKMVYDVAQTVKVPIVGMGGIMTADDALEFLIAGASMVAVGTANYINPRAPMEVLAGIKDYMKKYKMNSLKELVGSIRHD